MGRNTPTLTALPSAQDAFQDTAKTAAEHQVQGPAQATSQEKPQSDSAGKEAGDGPERPCVCLGPPEALPFPPGPRLDHVPLSQGSQSPESSVENLPLRARWGGTQQLEGEGAGKGGSQEQKALQGPLVRQDGACEAYRFLLVPPPPRPCPRAGESAHHEGEDRRRLPDMACLPRLHPGSWRYGLSAAPGPAQAL